MKTENPSLREMEARCAALEKQVAYYKAIAEEAGRNRLREIEQLHRQITERKKAEEKLRESDEKIRSWLEHSPVCTKILDQDFHLQYISSAGLHALQIDESSTVYGKKFPLDCYPEPGRTAIGTHLEKIKQTGAVARLETPVTTASGGQLWFQSTFVPITDEDGRCDSILVVSIDTTDQKRAEEAQAHLEKRLRQAQTIEAIGLMASGVAHDLNNILAGIIGYPELLLRILPDHSDLRKPILAIKDSGYRAAAVVADLLTIARGAVSIREERDLHTIITEFLCSPEAEELKVLHPLVRCRTRLDARRSCIACSPVHIKKCLMNLVTNAAEAIPATGTIHITTTNQYLEERLAADRTLKAGDYIVLSVSDTGAGISEKDLERIFEPFYTKKEMGRSGTGLGLTVVWNTVQEHDGNISVESTGAGTRFELYFPLAAEKRDVAEKPIAAGDITGRAEHVLVVDDDVQVLDIASKMLRMLGYAVDCVSSGEQAVQFVEEHSVDLLILDMLMPPGMNGYQAYKEIIKRCPGQKAVIASGFSENDDVQAAIQLGVHTYIRKPYSMDQLGCAVKEALAN